MKQLILICILSLISLHGFSQEEKPNIILINIDDMGWKDVGFMGSDYYDTPFLDSLASRGMIFENGYSSAANCAPSRASMLTGLWSPRHQILTVATSARGKAKDRKLIPIENNMTLSEDFLTFPQLLQNNGYQTLHAGKWHISDSPTDFGFDETIAGGSNGAPRSYFPPYGNVNWEGPELEYLTDAIVGKVIEKIDYLKPPYLLYYSPYTVHTPIQGKLELAQKYVDKPSLLGQKNAEYASMVENMDTNLKRMFQSLQENQLLDNTLIIFTSDNGGLKGITSQDPLRSGKGSYYEGGIRVPMLFVWEGKISAGSDSTPISNLDFYPTILDVAGIDSPNQTDGKSLKEMLLGKEELAERPLFWHFPIYLEAYSQPDKGIRDPLFRTRPGSVVRDGKWKLHYYFENQEIELFDLKNDISETKDLSKIHPDITQQLMNILQNWWKDVDAPIPTKSNPDYSPSSHK